MKSVGAAILLTVASLLTESLVVSGSPDPIILVNGITGSQLDVRHDAGKSLCNTLGKNFSLWVSELRFLNFECFSSELTLNFDRNSGQYSSTDDDILVSVPGFGDTNSVENIGQDVIPIPYFKDMVEYFVRRGYERGKNIRAAPYDWRLAPVELERRGYYDRLKRLVEETYRANDNTKVTIVAHSMGAPTMLYFFTQSEIIDQSWKDMYIGNFITLSGAWSGGNVALMIELSGLSIIDDRLGDIFSIFRIVAMRITDSLTPILRTFQSIYFLLPRPSVWGDTVIVSTPTQTYTANDYERLFSDIGLADGYAKYQGVERINENFPAPNVPTHCFYGVGVDTPLSFTYREQFPEGTNGDPEVTMGDGDGTVNVESSEVCLRWANANGDQPFNSKTFDRIDHFQIVQNTVVLQQIRDIVGAPTNPTSLWHTILELLGK